MQLPKLTSKLVRDLLLALAVVVVVLFLQWAVVPWTRPQGPLAVISCAVVSVLLIAIAWRLDLRSSQAQRAEQRLNLAQDETGVGLFELDYRDNTAYASPALCQILGQPVMAGSMPLQQWLLALNAGHVAESRRSMQAKVAAGELRYERELRVELPDGRLHWLLSRIRLDLDENGELVAARGATLDITARKQLVTELEAAQSQLRQQLDDLSRLHSLGNRLLAMPVLDEALQAMLEAVCSFHETPHGILKLSGPGGETRVAAHCGLTSEALSQLAATGEPMVPDSFSGLVAHSTPLIAGGDGRVLGVLTVLTTAATAPEERLLRLTDLCAGQASALIEREQALSMARETQARFEVALQSSSVAFTILAPVRDDAGRIVDFAWSYANPAAATLIGRPAQELVGRRILDLLPHAWDEPGFFERYVQVSEHGSTAEFDTLTRGPSTPRWVHVIASPLNGSVVLWFADITQRRAEQQALHDADRRKDEFLATLAHELRNPLAPIRHAAAIMRDAASGEPQRDWSLTVIERQLKHMALLLDDLLDVSRITRGTLPLRRERCELKPLVEAAAETSRPLFSERRHQLVLDLPDTPLWLDADPLRIAQVLGNLLVNPAKYTPPGGHVVLSARHVAGEVVITVTDNGNGLQPDDCENVFEMFMQVTSADARPQGGLGIGLALSRNLMTMHGGRLDAQSAGLGRGSTFTARLPAPAAAEAAPTVAPLSAPAASRGAPGRRILIADDNRDAADSLAMLLEMDGHDVQVAYDGREALSRYSSFRPEVALLDMSMPEHSGAEVAGMIRLQQGSEAITLVAVTGFGQERDRVQALEAGFDHHMTKPIEWLRLQSLIQALS